MTSCKTTLITGVGGQGGLYVAAFPLETGCELPGSGGRISLFDPRRINPFDQGPHGPKPQSDLTRIIREVRPRAITKPGVPGHLAASRAAWEYTADV